MRILLRDSDTGEFYKAPGLWLQSTGEATVFQSIESVVEQRETFSRPHLEMVAVDENGRPRFGVRLWRDMESKVGKGQ